MTEISLNVTLNIKQLPNVRVYITRSDLIGRSGVMTPENATFTLNKRSFFNVKLTLLGKAIQNDPLMESPGLNNGLK